MGKHLRSGAVLLNPFDGGLLADLVNARQIVARLPHQRGDLRILLGFDPVTLAHRLPVISLQLGDPASVRVEEGHITVDQLDRVAVS